VRTNSFLRAGALTLGLALGGALLGIAGSFGFSAAYEIWARIEHARHDALVARPPRALAARHEDYGRYPRAGFGLVFWDSNGNRLDTFGGTCTKDLTAHPDTTIALVLSPVELDSIYQAMIDMRFFDPDQSFESIRTGMVDIEPNVTVHLRARAGAAERELVWDVGTMAHGPTTDDQKRLRRLAQLIWRRIESNSEYRRLPRPWGGYD
jgi:hypothetical protein